MYTQEDILENLAQRNRRLIAFGTPAFLMLCGVVTAFILRVEWLTVLLTILCGGFCILCYGLFLSPIIAYGRHLNDSTKGRTRKTEGLFKSMEETTVQREGVKYYPMLLSAGDMDSEEDDRLFYYDANKPRPDWRAGEKLLITAHDKAVADWERV